MVTATTGLPLTIVSDSCLVHKQSPGHLTYLRKVESLIAVDITPLRGEFTTTCLMLITRISREQHLNSILEYGFADVIITQPSSGAATRSR